MKINIYVSQGVRKFPMANLCSLQEILHAKLMDHLATVVGRKMTNEKCVSESQNSMYISELDTPTVLKKS